MLLTKVERERLSDSRLKIQSASTSLAHVDGEKLPDAEQILECLDNADRSLKRALDRTESHKID
jgi:hypothetical protein